MKDAPRGRWLLGWTNHGCRFIRYLEARPNEGIEPSAPGWCTHDTYTAQVFEKSLHGGGDRDIIIYAWDWLPEGPDESKFKFELIGIRDDL